MFDPREMAPRRTSSPQASSLSCGDDRSLAGLLDLDALSDPPQVWDARDLGAVLRHQLEAPVEFGLAGDPRGSVGAPADDLPTDDLGSPHTFRALFHNPQPGLDLLHRTKQAAKAITNDPDAVVPREIGIVVYYLSILVARLRYAERITALDDRSLAVGVRTILSRDWLDDQTRQILCDGLAAIKDEPTGRETP